MNAVPSGAPAKQHDRVSRPGRGWMASPRHNPKRSAVDQRIGRVSGMKKDSPSHRRNPHVVAVVRHPRDHPPKGRARVYGVRRPMRHLLVERPKAEHVGTRYRLRGDAEDITDHAAYTGMRAAERVER